MMMYLNKGADARMLLTEGLFHDGGQSGYTGASLLPFSAPFVWNHFGAINGGEVRRIGSAAHY
jgi:hypothetical protein